MRVIAENEMKRGDAVIHTKRYRVTYIYLDKVAKETKTSNLVAFTVRNGQEKQVKEWFHNKYPRYEATKVIQIEEA
jgi:hypothetical protein